MDLDKLKSRIREALGAAGIGREISQNIDGIIDQMGGKKEDEKPARVERREERQEARQERREERHDDDKDEADAPRVASAKMAVKPARKTRAARKKK